MRWRGDGWAAQVDLPWLQVRGADGATALPDQASPGSGTTVRGRGDAWARLAREAVEAGPDSMGVDLVLKLKAANGSAARGLGSGARDVALQMDLTRRLGAITAFGEIGRRFTGDVPGRARCNDPWYAELGAFVSPTDGVELGAYHDARERIGRLGPLHETTACVAWRSGGQPLQLHATKGHAAAAAGSALGLSWRWRR